MPRVTLVSEAGMEFRCDATDYNLLRQWLDEWLPRLRGEELRIYFWPLFAGRDGLSEPDWITDTRLLGYHEPFPATDGAGGVEWIRQHYKALLRRQRELARAS